ncbi:hypothetical protein E4179_21455 [Citrobacter freundii]|nr:hypothetical protein CUC51_23180 [Citrobacter freundii]POU43821.1 hypothetical protein C3375_16410 [Citrobacter freundii complex sp. CFNIH12]PSF21527.1 hypothetical protein C6985_16315 [Escherichia coli]PCQ46122.1 hypothetical protein CQA31_17910 [Citrobacter freundii]PUU65486.1 hypothetical protein DCL23_06690 [Citrobacter freundii]
MPLFYCGHSLILRVIFGQNPDEKQAVVIFDVSNLQYVTPRQCDRGYVSHISLCLIAVTLGRINHTHLSWPEMGKNNEASHTGCG